MDRFQTTTGAKPAAGTLTFRQLPLLPAVSPAVAVDYGMLSKLIDMQVNRANGHQAKEGQRRLGQFVFELKNRFDRVLEDHQRLQRTLEDLQGGQAHLLGQLELHQKREELAILREQQDGKRIRELEKRLSFLLFEPMHPHGITIDAPEPCRFANRQPEILEDKGEAPEIQAAAATEDEGSEIIELLDELVDAQREEGHLLSGAAVDSATITGVDPEDVGGDSETSDSSSCLNTNYVLNDSKGGMLAAEAADPPAADAQEYPIVIITPEVDTDALEIIELKEEAIVGRPENQKTEPAIDLTQIPAPVTVEAAVAAVSGGPVASAKMEFAERQPHSLSAEARAHFDRGKLACQRKDYAEAVDIFNRYLELSPNDPRGPYNLAILHYRLRDYHRAGECARKALDLGYTAADRILAKIKSKSGAEAESEIAAEKSVSSDWLKTETLQDLSFPAAASVAEEPVDPAAAKQLFADGMAAYQKQAYRPARESFRRFVALMPAEPQGHYNLSILHYRLKEYEAALDCARRAQDLGSGSARRIIQKIESKLERQRSSDEISNAVYAPRVSCEDPVRFPAADSNGSYGAHDAASIWAADDLGEEINQSLFPAVAEAKPISRKDELIVFGSAAPDATDGAQVKAAGSVAAVPGEAEAEQFFKNERLNTIFKLGQTAVENKEYLKAINHFTKVTHLAPQDPRGYYHLAEVSFHLRFYETAREHALRALELGSGAAKDILDRITALQTPA